MWSLLPTPHFAFRDGGNSTHIPAYSWPQSKVLGKKSVFIHFPPFNLLSATVLFYLLKRSLNMLLDKRIISTSIFTTNKNVAHLFAHRLEEMSQSYAKQVCHSLLVLKVSLF